MSKSSTTVVGIDVGGENKGFHGVAISGRAILGQECSADPIALLAWCTKLGASIIAVDAPSGWSQGGSSRTCETELAEDAISCFSTPTKTRAKESTFYRWVFNGQRLYDCLKPEYPLYQGGGSHGRKTIETFPYAVLRVFIGRNVAAKPKGKVRRECLRTLGYDETRLPNIDFVDAALCAVAADRFRGNEFKEYGNATEGFIVVPKVGMNWNNGQH